MTPLLPFSIHVPIPLELIKIVFPFWCSFNSRTYIDGVEFYPSF